MRFTEMSFFGERFEGVVDRSGHMHSRSFLDFFWTTSIECESQEEARAQEGGPLTFTSVLNLLANVAMDLF